MVVVRGVQRNCLLLGVRCAKFIGGFEQADFIERAVGLDAVEGVTPLAADERDRGAGALCVSPSDTCSTIW